MLYIVAYGIFPTPLLALALGGIYNFFHILSVICVSFLFPLGLHLYVCVFVPQKAWGWCACSALGHGDQEEAGWGAQNGTSGNVPRPYPTSSSHWICCGFFSYNVYLHLPKRDPLIFYLTLCCFLPSHSTKFGPILFSFLRVILLVDRQTISPIISFYKNSFQISIELKRVGKKKA